MMSIGLFYFVHNHDRPGKLRSLLAVVSFAFLASATPLAAQTDANIADATITYEGMTLTLPPVSSGWERNTASDGIVLQKIFPADASVERRKKGAALIQIARPLDAQGVFPAEFQKFTNGFSTMKREKPLSTDKGLTINGHPILAHLYCCRGQNDLSMQMISVGIDARKRHHFLRLVTFELNRADEDETRKIFQSIVRSLRPTVADRAFTMEPPAGTDALKGVYKTLKTGIRPNVFGGTDFYSENRLMVFSGQGLYSTEIPTGSHDVATHCRARPKDCGFYRLKGSMIELREIENDYGMMSRSEEPIRISAAEIAIGDTVHTRIAPLAAGTRLSGSWRAISASSGQGAFTSGGFVSEKTLILSRDGRYERTNFTSVNSSVESGGVRTSASGGGRRPLEKGNYAIEGHTIVLTSDEGKATSLGFFIPIRDSDEVLIIDGGNFRKQTGGK